MIVPVIMWWDRQVIITRQNMILHICKVMTIDWTETQNTKLHILQLLQILRMSVSGMMMLSLPGWWIGEYEDFVAANNGRRLHRRWYNTWQFLKVTILECLDVPAQVWIQTLCNYVWNRSCPTSGFPFRRNANTWSEQINYHNECFIPNFLQ